MKKTLIVVDMQNDFIDMALGTKEAVAIVPKVKEKIAEYIRNGDEVIYTRDTHGEDYLDTAEGKKLPVPHCIKGTGGWNLSAEIQDALQGREYTAVEKLTSSFYRRLSLTHWARTSRERNFYNLKVKGRANCLAFGPGAGGNLAGWFYRRSIPKP